MANRLTIGLSIGADGLTAVWQQPRQPGRHVWRSPIPVSAQDTKSLESLRMALAELHSAIGAPRHARLVVAIEPPLAVIKQISMPRMTAGERVRAVALSADKYFLGLGDAAICATRVLASSGSSTSIVAAATSALLIDTLVSAAAETGFNVERIVPAHVAWAAVALDRWPELRRGDREIVVTGVREITRLVLANGEITLVRRDRANAACAPGTGGSRQRLLNVERGETHDPSELAAAGAALADDSLELVPPREAAARSRVARRAARWLIAATIGLLVATAGLYRWSLSNDLVTVRAKRVALHARVDRAVAQRDSLLTLESALAALSTLEASAPRWSNVVARVADALPATAFLTVFRADGDSALLEGQAPDAALVFNALRSAPAFSSVRVTAPVRQEIVPGQPVVERWTVTARARPAAPAHSGDGR